LKNRYLIVLVFLLIPVFSSSEDQGKVEVLSSIVCPVNKTPKLFVLTKEVIASPIESKNIPIHRVEHQNYLKLTRYNVQSDNVSTKPESVVWQESVGSIGPYFGWKFDLEFNPKSGYLYLVIFYNFSPNLVMWAYEIDPAGTSSAKLGGFTQHGSTQSVPEADKEKRLSDLFVKEYQIFGGPKCIPDDRMSSIIEDDSILVSVSQTLNAGMPDENCPALYFRFDFKTKKWNEVNIPK
jgi:hypothetical protein